MVKVKRASHRQKSVGRISVNVININKPLERKVVTNKPIMRQTTKEISEMKQYQNLIKLLK